ncbi:hypothetical protein OCK74_08180 [Chitinophagaceae bacterium LB-8]|jgi:hypothetical protein|uniref:Uncharacterized protein n=1 Tax=Paraflavisolibacter caeni TaxID=2982496 RepID=A0A9X2XNT9_9BACT|nr:hypothetical protein [Paraflavisolibacter caeni]MCU7549089.1 hypothetical protein [Paraflavisolibacter caeni]
MALQTAIKYRNQPLTYEITVEEEDVYIFRLHEQRGTRLEYIPEKIVIRRKGKLWVSDVEDHEELVNALVSEIENFNSSNHHEA